MAIAGFRGGLAGMASFSSIANRQLVEMVVEKPGETEEPWSAHKPIARRTIRLARAGLGDLKLTGTD
jgi:hypothetical protein